MFSHTTWTPGWCQWTWAALLYGGSRKGGGWMPPHTGFWGRGGLEMGEDIICMGEDTPMSMPRFPTTPLSLWRTWACKSCLWGPEGRRDLEGWCDQSLLVDHGSLTMKSLLKAQAEIAWHDFLKWLLMLSSQGCLFKRHHIGPGFSEMKSSMLSENQSLLNRFVCCICRIRELSYFRKHTGIFRNAFLIFQFLEITLTSPLT